MQCTKEKQHILLILFPQKNKNCMQNAIFWLDKKERKMFY